MIRIYGPRDRAPDGVEVVNVTSQSKDAWSRDLSPFYLGPVSLYCGYFANRMENAWQFSKVYAKHVNERGDPTDDYWHWAARGWKSEWAHRYPMGRGAEPLYSLWSGDKLTYVEARKRIYIPLYAKCVRASESWNILQEKYHKRKGIALWDFDGWDRGNMSWEEVVNCEERKMGHAFVLGMMLEGAA